MKGREGIGEGRWGGAVAAWVLILCGVVPTRSGEWSVPRAGFVPVLPADHGSHPGFKIEWWYLTGHLFAGERRFGFQATFFRLGRKPGEDSGEEAFGTDQLHLAHMGLSDPDKGRFLHEGRLNRAGWDAGAKVGDLDVFNGNWSLRREGDSLDLRGTIRAEAALSLRLEPVKKLVVFGEDGVSRKGPEGTAASHYLTFPRLRAEGTLRLGGETLAVGGEAWMDHEFSSSQLDRDQVGWNWACIQFLDGREIMAYVLRTKSGGISSYSRLFWIDRDGGLSRLVPGEYGWEHGGRWESPETGAIYPVSPRIVAPDPETGAVRRFRLEPLLDDQEIRGAAGGVSYWEGACDVREEATGAIVGRAYLEMTGYADDIGTRLR